jgi:hypothetical protein
LESAAYLTICEHLQKPHNAGSRRKAQFFNTLDSTPAKARQLFLQDRHDRCIHRSSRWELDRKARGRLTLKTMLDLLCCRIDPRQHACACRFIGALPNAARNAKDQAPGRQTGTQFPDKVLQLSNVQAPTPLRQRVGFRSTAAP